MARKDPHFRIYEAYEILENPRKKPSDKKVAELLEVIAKRSKNDALIYAWEKFQDDRSRTFLNAFLMADTSFDAIRRCTDIPVAVIQAYADYIFDMSVFRDRLDRISYVDETATYGDEKESRYLRAALSAGAPYLVWLLKGQSGITPKEYLQAQMIDSYHRAQAHRDVPLDSPIAREARVWAEIGTKNAVALHKIDPQEGQDALEQLRLKLVYDDGTINENTVGAPAPEDILRSN